MQIIILTGALVVLLFVFRWYTSPKQKGKRGEQKVSKLLSKLPEGYIVMNDLVFLTQNGTTQVDHLVLSQYGLFVIETKKYKGTIYGDDDRLEWTKVVKKLNNSGHTHFDTYKFYNPVKQSLGHVYALQKILKNYPHVPIIPIVVFVGYVDVSNVRCHNHVIYAKQLCDTISLYKTICLNQEDVYNIQSLILTNNVREIVKDKTHIQNVKKAQDVVYSKINSGICPRCGGQLVERKGRYGIFYGCSNYPKCKFTYKN